jgi:hypothetical protein
MTSSHTPKGVASTWGRSERSSASSRRRSPNEAESDETARRCCPFESDDAVPRTS